MKNISLLLMILGILIGTWVYFTTAEAATPTASKENNTQAIDSSFYSKSTNLRLQLNNLLREHAALGAMTLTALYKGEDTTSFMQLMKDNQDQLTTIVSLVYGEDTANEFDKLWTEHMQEYENYTLAKKNNDADKMNQAKKKLQTISDKLGTVFDNASNHLSAATVRGLMQEHVTGTLAVVDAVAAQDATKEADTIKTSYDQAGIFADALAQGMILDKPDLFKEQ